MSSIDYSSAVIWISQKTSLALLASKEHNSLARLQNALAPGYKTIGRGLLSLFPFPIVPRALPFSFSPASPQHKEACAEERDTKPLVWKRYPFINDMFSLRDTDKEEINNFIEHANNYHPTIKFTADISDKEIIFFDTCIYKGARFEKEYILDPCTCFQPSETFQYTHFKSCHPYRVKKSFVKGEGLRLLRTNSLEETFKENIKRSR